ncbi:OmpA family protein [Carboxylicivirga sp. M1479]|uniref:OmpA/MotB family protein n=1 Tax=Carboxylicivirga sp. M1479 TaxID=2594476 RepID=UPI0011789BB7|nr:OmpA family protein [Carboxylicivirga sp. M1479]TRX72501.1 OmpA family protein [Carboxylicivirga sp. M1479]
MKYFLNIILILLLASACVPLKQFDEIKDENELLSDEAEEATQENDALKVQNRELESDLNRYKNKVELLARDTARLGRQNRRLQRRYDDLNANYADVLGGLKATSTKDVDNKKLLSFLQQLQEDLQKREDDLMNAEQALIDKKRNLREAQQELETAQNELSEKNQRLAELEALLNKKDDAMHALKSSISNALTGFSSDELQVYMKNGKVYVSLEEKLLFPSGRYDVNEEGQRALKKIGRVLENNNDINIVVEGHTDNIPYRGKAELQDNWDLSVKRATSVVRILISNSKLPPSRITAAGRGEHIPLVNGKDTASLQRNRRTEIILTPRWSEVLDLLDMNDQ